MRIGVVMPLWVSTNPLLIEQTIRAASCLRSAHQLSLAVVCTRLHLIQPDELADRIATAAPQLDSVAVLREPGVDLSVAAAWNRGVSHSLAGGADLVLITANDVEAEPESIDQLAAEGSFDPTLSIWSGVDRRHGARPDDAVHEGCDFSFFMLRQATIDLAGTFDERFRPAYFEDNDYYARCILAGGKTRAFWGSRFTHHVSLTRRSEPEAEHHVTHWWQMNRRRYCQKWGVPAQQNSPAAVLANCSRHPWGDPSLPVTFWDRD